MGLPAPEFNSKDAAARRSRMTVWLLRSVVAGYVGVACALAAAGGITQSPQPYLIDVVWTMPCGIAALVSVYLGYGTLVEVGGLFVATTLATERTTCDSSGTCTSTDEPVWLMIGSATFNTIAFGVASVANILLLRQWLRARRARQAHAGDART